MLIQIIRSRKPFLASIALVGSFHRVCAEVAFEVFHSLEKAAAGVEGADVDFCFAWGGGGGGGGRVDEV
jgi:hypothetical protein